MRKLCTFVSLLSIVAFYACGDNDSSTGNQNTNNNHTLPPDATVQRDSSLHDGTVQRDSTVQRDASGGSANVGDPCTSTSQCKVVSGATTQCVTNIGGALTFPGGYCSASSCSTSNDTCVAAGGKCVSISGYAYYCLKSCASATQCRTSQNYTCTTIPGSSDSSTYCLPNTGSNLDGGLPY
jgi:hypothetical protein